LITRPPYKFIPDLESSGSLKILSAMEVFFKKYHERFKEEFGINFTFEDLILAGEFARRYSRHESEIVFFIKAYFHGTKADEEKLTSGFSLYLD